MTGKLLLIALGIFLVLVATACKGKIVYLGPDGNLNLITANGTDQIALTSDAKDYFKYPVEDRVAYSAPIWSWDGRYLALTREATAGTYPNITGSYTLVVFDSLTNTSRTIDLPDRKSQFFGFAWRRDRDTLYVGYTNANGVDTCFKDTIKGFRVVEVDPASGVSHLVTTMEDGSYAWIAASSPDPNLLAFYMGGYCEGLGRLCIFDLTSGERRCTQEAVGYANWSPDGKKLIFDTCTYLPETCGIKILDATTLAETVVFPEIRETAYTNPVWSPTGNLFVYSLANGPLAINPLGVWAASIDGSNTWKIDDGYSPGEPQGFSPDGLYIVYSKEGSPDKYEIWIATLNGKFKFKLADGAAPAWQPKGPTPTPTP